MGPATAEVLQKRGGSADGEGCAVPGGCIKGRNKNRSRTLAMTAAISNIDASKTSTTILLPTST